MSYEIEDGYKIRNQSGLYFLTFTVVGWIDLLSRKLYRDILLTNMQWCRANKGLRVGAYVIMTNHMHIIWQSERDNLSAIIRDYKSFCTKQMIAAIQREAESRKEWLLYMFEFFANRSNRNKEFKIWTNDNHPEEIFSPDFMRSKMDYIHNNPVRAGFVEKAEDYLYSSARNYYNGKGIFEVDYLI